jgi:4-alpha-glucanotransferase
LVRIHSEEKADQAMGESMARTQLFHALGLHMHQPPGNLRLLFEANPWEAEQILRCYERTLRYAEQYPDVARLHVSFSGVLLEQFLDPDIVARYRHIVDIPEMLERYRQANNIELFGLGYYHPIFPLIPRADWPEQLERGRAIVERVFGRSPRGFWPPELAFSMEMIPALVQAGYDYVIVDGVHVRPEDGVNDIFRPYVACHEGVCITIVPRDRDVSNAQRHGLNPRWLRDELSWRATVSPRPDEARLVTTWSDGENGGWFRQTHEPSGFFGHFFAPYMEQCRDGDHPITPVLLGDYLDHERPTAHARIQTGSWNVGASQGEDLSRWAGSESQRQAVDDVRRLSERYWALCQSRPDVYQVAGEVMVQARHQILEAETSCFLYWGDAWIPHLQARTRPAAAALDEVEAALRAHPPLSRV